MREILSYSPEIHVNGPDGARHVISIEIPEYETDEEVLRGLAVKTGAGTVGGIVEALRVKDSGAVKQVLGPQALREKKVWGWDEPV